MLKKKVECVLFPCRVGKNLFVTASAGMSYLLRSSSLPSLDCPLPSQFGQCELKMEIQPKPHHRAHYETEGSRGAIKSECGRHPIVKVRLQF